MDKRTAISTRAIEAIYSIIDRENTSQSAISSRLGCKPSKLTESLKGRMMVPLETISSLCEDFNISPEWLILGDGEMISAQKSQDLQSQPDHSAFYESLLTQKDRIIQQKDTMIDLLMQRIYEMTGKGDAVKAG